LAELTADFKRRVRLAEAAYLALGEALLEHDPERGAALWRGLRATLTTRFIGNASVDELVHIAFRAPDSPATAGLRSELIGLDRCATDEALLNVAIAATFNGEASWLAEVVESDKTSEAAWRRKRGLVLGGFMAGNDLPVPDAWPDGEIRTGHEELRRKSARFRYQEACARHWWRAYLAAEDGPAAYAAWVLFLRSADRRAWSWISDDVQKSNKADAFFQLKLKHAQLNRSDLKRAMKKT
jgi:hypothetical protein